MQFHQTSSASYDFRRNFDSIVRPGLIRFLDISADLLGNQFDADRRAGYTKGYVLDLRRALASEQKFANFREGIEPSPPMSSPPGTPPYIHPPWNAERAAAIAAEFEADVIDCERRGAADTKPVDIYRAVHLGTEMARKQNADGNLPFPIDVGPEAVAYAADRLKSKIERNAVHNPIGEVHEGLLSYRFLKTMPGGEKVVYIDSYKLRQAAMRGVAIEPAVESASVSNGAKISRKPARADPLGAITLGRGVDWRKPGGLLGRMADWIETQMQNPDRSLAVLSALATITPLVGWCNLYSPTGCALNGYYVGLAGTAMGKDAMLKLPGRLLSTVRIPLKRLYSSSDAFSLSGQENVVHKDPAILLALDEVSTNMFPRMFGVRASSHESAMRGMHMKLFSRNLGDPEYGFTSRAPGAINQLEDARDPQFSMLAANTPRAFWQAMPQAAIADGYLNRWLIVNAGERSVNDNVVIEDVPEDIAQSLREISIGGREAVSAGMRPKGRQIPWASDDVRAAWRGMRDRLLPLIDSETTEGYLVGRTAEHTIRLATKHAIGSLGLDAKVGMQDLRWGAALALVSARATIAGSAMMANTDHAKLVLDIETFIRKKKLTTLSELTQAVRNGDPQKRELALKELVQANRVEVTRAAPPGGGRPRVDIRWIG
jgi:hypothetical protein